MSAGRSLELPRVGETVDTYSVVDEIAHGGMAAVYAVHRGERGRFERLSALKLMLPGLAQEARFVSMFLDEARIAAQVQHPNVVQVFEVGQHQGLPYIAMEFLRGQALQKVLQRSAATNQALPMPLSLWLLGQVAEGLYAAHSACAVDSTPLGVVHRDINPQNVHIGYDGHVKVVDFGIASARGRITQTRSGELRGTLGYLAPERMQRGAAHDLRADLWSLGVLAWQMFAGQSLFRAETEPETLWNLLHKEVPDIRLINTELPDAAAEAIMTCLARVPDDRPKSAAHMADVFRKCAAALGGAHARELASRMQALFGEERQAEEQRLQDALDRSSTAHSAAQPADDQVAQRPVQPAAPRTGRSWRHARALPLLVVLAIGAALIAVALPRASNESAQAGRAASNAASVETTAVEIETAIVEPTSNHEQAATGASAADRQTQGDPEPQATNDPEPQATNDSAPQATDDSGPAAQASSPAPASPRAKRRARRRRRAPKVEPNTVKGRGTGLLDVEL